MEFGEFDRLQPGYYVVCGLGTQVSPPLLQNQYFQIPVCSGECPKVVFCTRNVDT